MVQLLGGLIRISHEQLRDSGRDRSRCLQAALAGGAVLQMDQAAPADQIVYRYVSQCRKESDMGCSVHLPAGGNH